MAKFEGVGALYLPIFLIMHLVGGWGHLIGDGGAGFWIAMRCYFLGHLLVEYLLNCENFRAIKRIFDTDDGLLCSPDLEYEESDIWRLVPARQALFAHFGLDSKLAILDILYNSQRFSKSLIASFAKTLATCRIVGIISAFIQFKSSVSVYLI